MPPKRRTVCNAIAAFFSIAILMPILMMAIDREIPVILTFGELSPSTFVLSSLSLSGEQTTVTWTGQRLRKFGIGLFDCDGTVKRRIIDAAGYVIESKLSPIESVALLGDKEIGTFHKEVSLPPMTPGIGTYQVITQYWCNPVQKYILPINHIEHPIHFVVLPEPKAGQTP